MASLSTRIDIIWSALPLAAGIAKTNDSAKNDLPSGPTCGIDDWLGPPGGPIGRHQPMNSRPCPK